jgi:hypothetical protein
MKSLGICIVLVAPFLAMLTKHVYTCQMNVLQVSYDQICFKTLRDTWFEVFGSKIPVLGVLDCHYSPRRAITRHNKLEGRTGGLLASYSPWRAVARLPSNVTRHGEQVMSPGIACSFWQIWWFSFRIFCAVFYKCKPLKTRSQMMIKESKILMLKRQVLCMLVRHGIREKQVMNRVVSYPLSKGKLEPRHSRRELAS